MDVLTQLQQYLGVPIKFLHVVRNPYDNIATMLLRALKKREEAEFGEKVTGYLHFPAPTWRGRGTPRRLTSFETVLIKFPITIAVYKVKCTQNVGSVAGWFLA